jgi:hypothetical protein
MLDPEEEKAPRLRFTPEISAGNLLIAVALFGSVLTWGLRLEGRVDGEVRLRDEQHADLDRRLSASETQHRDDLRDIKDFLARIDGKLDGKVDKAR